ncbi:hypothetical protein G6M70_15790 [Agrobacterium tumefaciens]|uniref:hypothetical protein n=1 Tax=Agrobacterium tumefaciens TaxID=358 RepID=UPI001572D335|nr:hypothetical protein [Agrobacterium tumefaciens]NSZ02379.1 hypothetical protein [Agrobacterium tumefaciens]NSZ39893.1 hypothetical protein [Agrobacterium tumefaciens]NTB22019.1 hypothetical protein [Agrobacterium tumefaciens]NTB30223.1 hypothetical protein [Agrobacterium tumefaciens]NTB34256.1 hypothetical protein [Agrobacterium tumefaciens]
MTLLLLWKNGDEITVIADTLFGGGHGEGSAIGPKIFPVPIAITDLGEAKKETLPNMGFAFAGNVLSGQFAHALASTCLQNLAAPTTTMKPDVADVARYYADCGLRIVEERRRHKALDGYGFEGVVFGYSDKNSTSKAYHFNVHVNSEGNCVAPLDELSLPEGKVHPFGSGASYAREVIAHLEKNDAPIDPWELMDFIIACEEVPSVGGEIQAATSQNDGVELRPVQRFFRKRDSGELDVDFAVMGINIHRMGMVAGYVPIGTPLQGDSAERLNRMMNDIE